MPVEDSALMLAAKLLEFGASDSVEFHGNGDAFKAVHVARRRGESFAARLEARLRAAEEL